MDIPDIDLFVTNNGKKVSYRTLLQDIYENNQSTGEDVRLIINKLSGMVVDTSTAIALMEHFTQMMGAKIKNDDLLIKLVAILSRANKGNSNDKLNNVEYIEEEEILNIQREVRELATVRRQ